MLMLALSFALLAAPAADHPCQPDAEKFCKDVKPGGGRIARCMQQNEASLSAACKAKRAEFVQKMEEAQEACQADVERFCAGVQPGGGRVLQCLKEHEAELSEACKAVGAENKARREEKKAARRASNKELQEACKADAEQYCKAEKPGGGRIITCLKKNQGNLSEGCKAALGGQ